MSKALAKGRKHEERKFNLLLVPNVVEDWEVIAMDGLVMAFKGKIFHHDKADIVIQRGSLTIE